MSARTWLRGGHWRSPIPLSDTVYPYLLSVRLFTEVLEDHDRPLTMDATCRRTSAFIIEQTERDSAPTALVRLKSLQQFFKFCVEEEMELSPMTDMKAATMSREEAFPYAGSVTYRRRCRSDLEPQMVSRAMDVESLSDAMSSARAFNLSLRPHRLGSPESNAASPEQLTAGPNRCPRRKRSTTP